MKYSRWLKTQYPHLLNENDVTVQNYIRQAKDDTQKVRLIISLLATVLAGLLGYVIGYLLGRHSSFNTYGSLFVILLYVGVLIFLSSKLEQRFIKQRLAQLLAG